jgi:CDP-diacylglycerol--glycerol-3-phosphate 3-phosphatidyltransferase
MVNAITLYRLIAVPVLLLLVFAHQVNLFKWLLAISFFTDLIDGWLARSYKVTSIMGAKLDSVADDCTIVAAITAMVILKSEFLKQQILLVGILLTLFIIQTVLAFIQYGKISNFHTYAAKCAALLQGTFLILLFFLPQPPEILFYIAFAVTAIDLIEEIILVILLREWKANVKGLYWLLRSKDIL